MFSQASKNFVQRALSSSLALVSMALREQTPLWEKKKKKQKANTGKCFRDYYFIYLILFYSFNAMLNFLQKHLVVCNSRLILGTIAVSESVTLTQ